MVELEEVDLAKALARLAKLAARVARDIVPELDSPERTLELAEVCEEAARQLRERAAKQWVVEAPQDLPAIEPPRPFSASGP